MPLSKGKENGNQPAAQRRTVCYLPVERPQTAYQWLNFNSIPYEAVEEYGVTEHSLHTKLPNIAKFWRHHVAPPTNCPENTYFRDNTKPIISRIAERSYDIYCNISDALDELRIVNKGEAKAPRYRACLNVLRCAGDAIHLFDDLVNVIGWRDEDTYEEDGNSYQYVRLAQILGTDLILFPDWRDEGWINRRRIAISYRNRLAHQGRPWLNFENDEQQYVGTPYVLKAEYCDKFHTWINQRQMFQNPAHRTKFTSLFTACRETCKRTISYLDDGYGQILDKLDLVLNENPDKFHEYRRLWGWP